MPSGFIDNVFLNWRCFQEVLNVNAHVPKPMQGPITNLKEQSLIGQIWLRHGWLGDRGTVSVRSPSRQSWWYCYRPLSVISHILLSLIPFVGICDVDDDGQLISCSVPILMVGDLKLKYPLDAQYHRLTSRRTHHGRQRFFAPGLGRAPSISHSLEEFLPISLIFELSSDHNPIFLEFGFDWDQFVDKVRRFADESRDMLPIPPAPKHFHPTWSTNGRQSSLCIR